MNDNLIANALDVLTAKIVEIEGPSVVREALNDAEWKEYAECKWCDTEVPSYERTCLLCGNPTVKEDEE